MSRDHVLDQVASGEDLLGNVAAREQIRILKDEGFGPLLELIESDKDAFRRGKICFLTVQRRLGVSAKTARALVDHARRLLTGEIAPQNVMPAPASIQEHLPGWSEGGVATVRVNYLPPSTPSPTTPRSASSPARKTGKTRPRKRPSRRWKK